MSLRRTKSAIISRDGSFLSNVELDMDCYDDDDYDDVDETYKPDTQQQEESDNFDSSDSSVEASENDTELQKPRKRKFLQNLKRSDT